MKDDAATIPYVTSYAASADFTFPTGFTPSRHGLLRCETVRDGPQVHAYLRWRSEAHWKANGPVVGKLLGLGNPDASGPVVEELVPRDPPWKRHPITVGKALIAVAALFGALSAVRDYFAELFFSPDIAITVADSSPTSYHTGAELSIPLLVRNQALLGRAQVRVLKAELLPVNGSGSPVGLRSTKVEIPQLTVGQAEELRLSGTAPVFTAPGSKPTDYALHVEVAEKEGLFIPSRHFTYAPRTFAFWSDHVWESGVTSLSPVAGRIEIGLYPGRAYPAGIHGQMIVRTAAEPNDIDLQSGGKPLHRYTVPQDGSYTTKLEFQTDPLQSFQRCPITINVGCRRSMTQQQWALAKSTLRVEFE
jgi:hypothetical protein